MNDLLYRCVHQTAVEHRGIVTSAAPFRRLRPCYVLHVLNRLAIPLIVERGEVVRRAIPLLENIFVATLAGLLRFHEVLAWNLASTVDLCRTWEESAMRPVALSVH